MVFLKTWQFPAILWHKWTRGQKKKLFGMDIESFMYSSLNSLGRGNTLPHLPELAGVFNCIQFTGKVVSQKDMTSLSNSCVLLVQRILVGLEQCTHSPHEIPLMIREGNLKKSPYRIKHMVYLLANTKPLRNKLCRNKWWIMWLHKHICHQMHHWPFYIFRGIFCFVQFLWLESEAV